MAGAEAKIGKRHKVRVIVAGVVTVLILVPGLLLMRGILRRRRERAVERLVEALGGSCEWEADPPPWPFAQLAPLLGERFAKGRARLYGIALSETKVTDADLVHLEGLTGLKVLYLSNRQLTDAGLVHLEGLTGLEGLLLNSTQVTDAGLVRLEGLTALECLSLENTQVTDAGLVHLKGLTRLKWLLLTNTQVTDAGLAHLKGLAGLKELYLTNTQVTDAGVAKLKMALPGLTVKR